MAINPYQPPQTPPDSAADRVRVSNYNQAGAPLAIAFLVVPLLMAALIWLTLNGGPRDRQGNRSLASGITLVFLATVGEAAALVYAFRVPVLWIEIGPVLRYRTLASTHEIDWGDVQRIWFDRDDSRVMGARIVHHALVIQINDYKDLRVLVPAHRMALLWAIMAAHPKFKTSPFDDYDWNPPDAEEDNEGSRRTGQQVDCGPQDD